MELDLHNSEWDACVIGNGVSALWLAHWLWSSKKSVLWISSEEVYSAERALIQHAWFWGLNPELADMLSEQLQGFQSDAEPQPFDLAFFDARSSAKRFRKFGEAKQEWGDHEKDFFETLGKLSNARDLWAWHSKLRTFHDTGMSSGPTTVELFNAPRFVRAQGWPLLQLKTEGSKLQGVVLSGLRPTDSVEIKATKFYLGDFDEYLPSLIKDEHDSKTLASALKGHAYQAGFGLRLWHKPLASAITQTAIVPLIVSADKGEGSHVIGRFVQHATGLESHWVGFLTDEEIEDNNEILKKIKQTKRALERAMPGFVDSVERESVTFEPKMRATDLVKKRSNEALGAILISDHQGPEVCAEAMKKIFFPEAATPEKNKSKRHGPRGLDRMPEAGV